MCSKSEIQLTLDGSPEFKKFEDDDDRPEILTPPPSCEEQCMTAKEPPPDLPKMFLDLLEPVQGLRPRKLEFTCPVCSLRLASHNSLVTHNKTHGRPACLHCLKRFPSHSLMARHSQNCRQVQTVMVTSKYGRSRNVRCYLGLS
ncbi:uncharacterized protein LOC106671886 isoform X2 [Cimex lectularius]|nr:uncharacterized protein LOC106671886 isoform X2 [Cimex lectularius]XP_014258333.1 uncharacterized protein LOC106671886 isoform X2 [Cimex lectularius]XP_014258334.1 uncharacterized protein LOC106671886 isoform X2 [Cimex lectularius]